MYSQKKLFCGLGQPRWQTKYVSFETIPFCQHFGQPLSLFYFIFIKIPDKHNTNEFYNFKVHTTTYWHYSHSESESDWMKNVVIVFSSLALLVPMKWNNICTMRNSKQCATWLYCQSFFSRSFGRSLALRLVNTPWNCITLAFGNSLLNRLCVPLEAYNNVV